MKGSITLNMKEQRRNDIITKYINKEITSKDVSKLLHVTERQVFRIKAKYLKDGISSIPHQNKFKVLGNSIDQSIKDTIVTLYKFEFYGWNFKHFNEKLESEYNIKISYNALYTLLTKNDFISPKSKRKKKIYSCCGSSLEKYI